MIQNLLEEGGFKPPFFISYLITDPEIYGNTPQKLEQSLTEIFEKQNIDIVCFRDKISPNYEQLAIKFLEIARKFKINKVLINSNVEICNKYKFDGIHFNSQQFSLLKEKKYADLYTIISCHTEKEIQLAKFYSANAVTYSPIFFKENKGEPKGIENLKDIVSRYQDKYFLIIALGGIIEDKNIKEIIKTGAQGFASIRYFKV